MSEPLDGAGPPLLPSSSVVLEELKVLRQREGISPERVQRYAPVLQTLPVVLDEREQRRFSVGDEHIAAYNAVGCTIENLVRDPRKKVILRHTLNYEGNKFDLTSRRKAAAAELFSSTKACEQIETQAYVDLAALLIDATATPCATRRRIVTDQEVLDALNHFRNLRDLQAVSLHARERGAEREASALYLFKRNPRLRTFIEGQPSFESPVNAGGMLDALLHFVVDTRYSWKWREWGGVLDGNWILPPKVAHLLLEPAESNVSPVFRDAALAAQSFPWPADTEEAPTRFFWDSERESPTVDFYLSRKDTLLVVYREAALLAQSWTSSQARDIRRRGPAAGDAQ